MKTKAKKSPLKADPLRNPGQSLDEEMDADHVSAWSKGGATDPNNCQLLCKTHNKAKGNR